MRKGLLVAAIAALLLHATASTAEVTASCRRTAGPSGIPQNIAVGGVCTVPVPVAETAAFTIRLTPSPGFTGVLTAKVTSSIYGGVSVAGLFVAGELVNGMDEATTTLVAAPDADWKLTVAAGEPTTTSTYLFPPLPPQATVPGLAIGEFGAEVLPAVPAPPAE